MPLPAGVETVTVSGTLTLPDGTWYQGKLLVTAPDVVTLADDDAVLGGTTEVVLVDGAFSVELVATDATGIDPTGWTYQVDGRFSNAPNWTRYVSLPKATPGVDLADVLIADPVDGEVASLVPEAEIDTRIATHAADTTSVHGIADTAVLETQAGATAKVTAHSAASDPHGDRAAAAAALAAHEADTTAVHGITDTSALETQAGATSKVSTHAAAADPHGDRAYTNTQVATRLPTAGGTMTGDLTLGARLRLPEGGADARMGVATLVAGIADVNTTAVAANSRIFLTNQSPSGTVGAVRVQSRTPGSTFRIQSSQLTDTSQIAWVIIDPA